MKFLRMLLIIVLVWPCFAAGQEIKREALIEGDSNQARAAGRRSESRLAEYEAAIRTARTDGYRRIEQERAQALRERQRLIDEARSAANSEVERARAEISGQATQARGQLESEARQIAERISRTLLGRAGGGGA